MSINEMWGKLLEIGVAEGTLQVVTSINGFTEQSMSDILYVVTGFTSFTQLAEEEQEVR